MDEKKKIYLFYLTLPEDLSTIFSQDDIAAFRYVNGYLKSLTQVYDSYKKNHIYLYAMTDIKSRADIFESIHDMSIFTKVVKKLTDKEYKKLKKENLGCVIDILNLSEINLLENLEEYHNKTLICIKYEKEEILNTLEIFLNCVLLENSCAPYHMLKEKYVKALDLVGFTKYALDAYYQDPDVAYYNESYNITAEGYYNTKGILPDYVALYIKTFSILLKK